jgi:hypothetical protein
MKTPRPPNPIESFGSELFNALVQGSKQSFVIPNIRYREAVKFRLRCHQLRNRMRIDNHPLATVVAKTRISIEWDHSKIETLYNKKRVPYPKSADSPVTLVIEPHDSEFSAALKAAGIDVGRQVDPKVGLAPPTASEASGEGEVSLDKLLGDL